MTVSDAPAPLRLFVAVDVPADVRSDLASRIDPLTERIPDARWTGSDGWHVTMKFLGNTPSRLVEWVLEGMRSVAAGTGPFETRLTELGVFPGPARARVIWAGLADPDGSFARMAAALGEVMEENFVAEVRPFAPHLTLARLKTPRKIAEFAPDLVGRQVPSRLFPVDRLTLYRSRLSPSGARYEALEGVILGS